MAVMALTGCGGGGSKSDGASSSTTASSKPSAPTDSSSDDSADTLEGIDLTKTPAAVGLHATTDELVYFAHLSDEPKVTFSGSVQDVLLSADRRYAAVHHKGDAINKARLEIVAADTGKVVQAFEIDSNDFRLGGWSPDSSAVLVGGIAPGPGQQFGAAAVYGVDGSVKTLTTTRVDQPTSGAPIVPTSSGIGGPVVGTPWVTGTSGTTVMECKECTAPGVLRTSKGKPVVVVGNTTTHVNGRYDPDSEQIVPFDGEFQQGVISFNSCGRFANMTLGSDKAGVYDSDTGRITPIPLGVVRASCPVPSNHGDKVAYASPDGPVVVDLGTGESTQVGREGSPIGWSSDDSKLLVTDDQNIHWFVVAADGSGGKAATVDVGEYCVVGTTGTVLVRARSGSLGFLAYDIGSDSAETLANANAAALDEPCQVSPDSKWVLSGRSIIDLAGGHAATLPADGYTVSLVEPSSISAAL